MATSDRPIVASGLADKRLRLVSHLSKALPSSTTGDDAVLESPTSLWRMLAVLCLSLLLVSTTCIAFFSFLKTNALREDLAQSLAIVENRLQKIDSAVNYDSKHQRLLLGIRDEILSVNARLSLHEAYRYSEILLRASEKYPSVDPLMLLSIGIVESRFDRLAHSPADALGLYQIWPATGRMLARILEWEYSDELLHDSEANTEMAALYLDILQTVYSDWSMILAEYNGGPLNAAYMRAGSSRLAKETLDYVPKVLDNYGRLREQLGSLHTVTVRAMHQSASRNAKRLWTEAVSAETAPPKKAGARILAPE